MFDSVINPRILITRSTNLDTKKMNFEQKIEAAQAIAEQQQEIRRQIDALLWEQHGRYPTNERDERIKKLAQKYSELGQEYCAIWNAGE